MSHSLETSRSPWATWGTAHLAWGVAILIGLIYAARFLPVDVGPWLSAPTYASGIAYVALLAWQQIDRGWRLRRRDFRRTPSWWLDGPPQLLVVVLTALVQYLGSSSHALTAGLDHLVTLALGGSLLSLVLSTVLLVIMHRAADAQAYEDEDRRPTDWPAVLTSLAALVFAAFLLSLEWLPL